MRRRVLIALGLVWVVATAASFEAGRRAEREYRAGVERLRERTSLGLVIERYDRGVFGSSAVTVLDLRQPEPEAAPVETGGAPGAETGARLILSHEIDHGPYPFSWVGSDDFDGRPILVRVSTAPMLELETEEAIEEVPLPLSIEALFTQGDGATLWMVPDPDRIGDEDPELSADWAGVYAEAWFAYDGSAFSGELEVPRLAFEDEDGAFRLDDLFYEFEYERMGEELPVYLGGSRFRLGRLAVEGEQGAFSLHDLEIEDSSEAAGGVWSMQVESSLGGLSSPEGRYGPGELALGMTGLALEPLAELGSVGQAVGEDAVDPGVVKAELMVAAGAVWPQLMAAGPALELSRLRLATPDGELRMAFRVGVDTSEPMLLAHPFMTLPALEIDAELSLPEPMLHAWLATPRPVMTPPAEATLGFGSAPGAAPWTGPPAEMAVRRVETWIERGFIERHGGSYVLSVRVRKGAIRLNGRVVATDAL